jgi:hypothetical protein
MFTGKALAKIISQSRYLAIDHLDEQVDLLSDQGKKVFEEAALDSNF